MSRKTKSWVDAFYESTSHLPSPPLFRRWAGISIIAGALERKVWIRSFKTELYPNLYTFLVGEPGVGKTVLTDLAHKYWNELGTHHLASSSLTKASLIDDLRDAERHIVRANCVPSMMTFNSLLIACDELAVLIPGYESDFMNTLTAIYDGKIYSERRRSRDLQFEIKNPQMNLLAATTPGYLKELLPEGAWDQGFMSRTIILYSGEKQDVDPLAEEDEDEASLDPHLVHDLKTIGGLVGKMTWSPEAVDAFREWHANKMRPYPEHPKLRHYVTRRAAHTLKLCQVASAARGDDLLITLEDFLTARGWLLEAEAHMTDIFKSMTIGGDARVIEDAWHYCFEIYGKENKPIAEARLINFLSERTPAHNVMRLLELMEKAGILQKRLENKIGNVYVPRAKRRID